MKSRPFLEFKKPNFLNIAQLFFNLGIFLLPLRFRSLLYAGDAYSHGFFNEYLAFFLHASEICFFFSLLSVGLAFVFREINSQSFAQNLEIPSQKLLLPFLLLLTTSILTVPLAESPFLALLHFFRTLEFALLAFFVVTKIFDLHAVLRILFISISLQALLAITQFFAKGELGLHFLGESFFTTETFNVAKTVLPSGEVLVRGMGTLPHANILGGISAITLLFLASYSRKNILNYFTAFLIFVGMFFSFSRAALLSFFIGISILLIFQFRRRIVSTMIVAVIFLVLIMNFGLSFFARVESSSEIPTRFNQIQQALNISSENIFGLGKGSYTVALAQAQPDLQFWQLQPVHNFFLLKMTEESVLVALAWISIFGFLAWWSFQKKKFEALSVLTAIFLLANFDHYFSTNFTAEALLWLALAFVVVELSEGKPKFEKNKILSQR